MPQLINGVSNRCCFKAYQIKLGMLVVVIIVVFKRAWQVGGRGQF